MDRFAQDTVTAVTRAVDGLASNPAFHVAPDRLVTSIVHATGLVRDSEVKRCVSDGRFTEAYARRFETVAALAIQGAARVRAAMAAQDDAPEAAPEAGARSAA